MATYSFTGEAISASVNIDDPYAPISIVTDRFNDTLTQANSVLELLIGADGSGGLIGDMESALTAGPAPTITPPTIDTDLVLDESGLSLPTFTGTLVGVPTVDVDFTGIDLPDDISLSLSWAEATLPTDVFDALSALIIGDMADGSTGINATVEAAIYTRARNRQQAANLAEYNKLNGFIGGMQHSLPTGAGTSLLADFSASQVRQVAEIEAAIVENQAKLAQENRKNVVQGAIPLENLIRQTRTEESSRALEATKTLQTLVLQEYAEKIKAFQALWDGKKAEVQAKAESVRAAVETNKGLIDVYTAQVSAFGEAEKAIAARNDSRVKALEAVIKDADMRVRAEIGEAEALVGSYTSEMSIKERISTSRAQVASHVAAALLSAVNASASLGYSGSESSSKSFGVSVSGQEGHSYSEV